MKRALLIILLTAGLVTWYLSLPPAASPLADQTGSIAPVVRGAIHVHTKVSDGTGTYDEVAAAAARAGLAFVILTDHGDGTREPEAPVYRDGVLVIDAVEISTEHGHVVAIGLPRAPFPLGGEGRDVVEDIARWGGMSIAAHPASPKAELRWTEWAAPFGGLEWLNGDSEWRDEPVAGLVRALLAYPIRRSEALASLLDRPEAALRRWDALTPRRRVVAVAAADAHARLGVGQFGEPYSNTAAVRVPAYERVFRTFSIAVTGVTLTGDARADAGAVVAALQSGHVHSAIDALAGPVAFSFTAASGGATVQQGDLLQIEGPVELRVDTNAPSDARISLLKDGTAIASSAGRELRQIVDAQPGVYRVEMHWPGAPGVPPVPWVVSNPIYVGRSERDERLASPRGAATEFAVQYDGGPATGWAVESSTRARGALDVVPAAAGTQVSLRYALGGTRSESPYVALVMPAGPALSSYDRLVFRARAREPMRLSVQVRVPVGVAGERWHRSVYVDNTEREIVVFFDDMTPSGPTTRRRPVLATVESVLFVIDTVNTKLGTSGQLWLDDVRYGK